MSGSATASRAAVLWFDALRVGDADDTRAKDWSAVIVDPEIGLDDRLAQIVSVLISRRDRKIMTIGLDLTCQSFAIDPTQFITTLTFRNGQAGVAYLVTTTVLTSSGTTLYRDAYILVAPVLG